MDSLLEDLVSIRFAAQLPAFAPLSTSSVGLTLTQTLVPMPTILALARQRADELVASLLALFRRLEQQRAAPRTDYLKSAEKILACLAACLKSQLEHLKSNYNDLLTASSASEEEQIRIKQKLQSVTPPPLPETLAKSVLDMVYDLLEMEPLRQVHSRGRYCLC
jgi:hypothetical protein